MSSDGEWCTVLECVPVHEINEGGEEAEANYLYLQFTIGAVFEAVSEVESPDAVLSAGMRLLHIARQGMWDTPAYNGEACNAH